MHGRPDMVGLSSIWYRDDDRSVEYDIPPDRGASGLVRNELQGARHLQMCRPLADPAVTASLEAIFGRPGRAPTAKPGADRLYESCPILYPSTLATRAGEGGPRAAVGAPFSYVIVSVRLQYDVELAAVRFGKIYNSSGTVTL